MKRYSFEVKQLFGVLVLKTCYFQLATFQESKVGGTAQNGSWEEHLRETYLKWFGRQEPDYTQ